MSSAVFFLLMVLFFLDLFYEVTYPLVSPYLTWTSGEWHAAMATFMAGVITLVEVFETRRIPRGVITGGGIMLDSKNTVIPFQNITMIKTGQRGISVLQTAEGKVEARMDEWTMVKLPRAGFTHWSVDKDSATASRGPAGAGLSVEYKPTGKYASRNFASLATVAAFFGLLFLIDIIGIVAFFISFPLLFLFFFGIDYHKEVVVTIEDSGIKLRDENLVEHFMAFAEIDSVEKGWVRTRLTARDGRVMRLPRALYLLPEFIEEYVRPRKA